MLADLQFVGGSETDVIDACIVTIEGAAVVGLVVVEGEVAGYRCVKLPLVVFIDGVGGLYPCGVELLLVEDTTVAAGDDGGPSELQRKFLAEVIAYAQVEEVPRGVIVPVEVSVLLLVGIDAVGEVVDIL